MILPTNIKSLTEFQRHARAHLERLRETGEPEVLTVNGEAAVVVQDVQGYERLLRRMQELEAAAVLAERMDDVRLRRAKTIPAAKVLTGLRAKLKRPARGAK